MPNSRRDFERNMYLLSEAFLRGQVHIAETNFRTIRDLKNARMSPNMRGNLNTVHVGARLMANMIARRADDKELQMDNVE